MNVEKFCHITTSKILTNSYIVILENIYENNVNYKKKQPYIFYLDNINNIKPQILHTRADKSVHARNLENIGEIISYDVL